MKWEVYFDGARFDVGTTTCHVSPDPDVPVLVLDYKALRADQGRPKLSDLHGNPEYAFWACNGRCLVYQRGGGIDHVDTGAFETLPALPGSPLAISPDLHTLVLAPKPHDAHAPTLTFCVMDLEATKATAWTVPAVPFSWMDSCHDVHDIGGDCLDLRAAHVVWSRDRAGRDAMVAPPPSPETKSESATWETCGHEK